MSIAIKLFAVGAVAVALMAIRYAILKIKFEKTKQRLKFDDNLLRLSKKMNQKKDSLDVARAKNNKINSINFDDPFDGLRK